MVLSFVFLVLLRQGFRGLRVLGAFGFRGPFKRAYR